MTRRTVALGLGALIVVSATFVGVQTAHAGKEPTCGRPLATTSTRGAASVVAQAHGTQACTAGLASSSPVASGVRPASTSPDCTVTGATIDASAHATFDVQGHCTVTLVAYELHGKGTLGEQTLYDSTSKDVSCASQNRRTSSSAAASSSPSPESASSSSPCSHDLAVTIPNCRYQVDLVLGQPRNPPTGYKPGEVLTWRYGGEGECATTTTTTQSVPTTTITPSTPTTSAPPNPTIPPTSVTVANQMVPNSTPVFGGSPTPTELPHTGGGELLSVALGALGLIGAGQYVERRGRRRRARL